MSDPRPSSSTPRRRARPESKIAPTLPAEAAGLAWAAPQHAPSAKVKTALLARIAASKRPTLAAAPPVPDEPGWKFASIDDPAGWLVLPFPGVRMKEVAHDASHDTVFVIVDMAPGARIPDHPHDTPEFGLIITGDVTTAGRLIRAGESYISEGGVQHRDIVSPSGCRGLITLRRGFWDYLRAKSRSA